TKRTAWNSTRPWKLSSISTSAAATSRKPRKWLHDRRYDRKLERRPEGRRSFFRNLHCGLPKATLRLDRFRIVWAPAAAKASGTGLSAVLLAALRGAASIPGALALIEIDRGFAKRSDKEISNLRSGLPKATLR